MKKLNFKKMVISELSDKQKLSIKGGGTTSYGNCTGLLCCGSNYPPTSMGNENTCTLDTNCTGYGG